MRSKKASGEARFFVFSQFQVIIVRFLLTQRLALANVFNRLLAIGLKL